MGTGFQWQTEADEWIDQPAVERPAKGSWFLVLALFILLMPAAIVYDHLQERVAEATARAQRSVLSSHQLILSPAAADDADLLRSFISGRDPRWTNDYLELSGQGRLFDYPELGLRRLYVLPAGPATPQVILAPDLHSAEVTAELAYVVEGSDGMTRTVLLERVFLYRRGTDRWLWSPPETDFWGELVVAESDYLTAHHPGRDSEIVGRLLTDLDRLIQRMCRQVEGPPCGVWREPPVIYFGESPIRLLAIERARRPRGNSLFLPTPSLLGIPADEPAYQALFQGYARWVLPPLIADRAGWSCCQHGAFFDAALTWQLSELGLAPPPLVVEDYDELFQRMPPMVAPADLWDEDVAFEIDRQELQELYALVAFLLEAVPGVTAADLIGALQSAPSYGNWLATVGGARANEGAWRLFLFQQTAVAQAPPPLALPDQEALVQCAWPGGNEQTYNYNPALERWSPMPQMPRLTSATEVLPLSDGYFIIQENGVAESAFNHRISLWRRGEGAPIMELTSNNPVALYVGAVDPAGSRAVLDTFNPVTGAIESQLLDVTDCSDGECPLKDLAGRLRWSPDGLRTLITDYRDDAFPLLYLGNADGQIEAVAGPGNNPVWLDNLTYGSFGLNSQGGSQFQVRRLSGEEVASLQIRTLWRELPEYVGEINASRFSFAGADGHISWPGTALVSLYDSSTSGNRLFDYHWPSGELKLRTHDADFATYPRFSPGGKWLALYEVAYGRNTLDWWRLYLIDRETGLRQPSVPSAPDFQNGTLWSRDDRWLLRSDGELAFLMAPGTGYQQALVGPVGACDRAVWLER